MKQFKDCKILIFAPWIPPHRNSEAHVTGRLLLSFINAGIDFDVVSSPTDRFEDQKDDLSIWAPLERFRHIVPQSKKGGFEILKSRVSTILSTRQIVSGGMTWADFAIKKGKELAKLKKYDLIMSRSQPAVGHLPALVLSRYLKKPWIANWNDIEPAVCAPIPYGNGIEADVSYYLNRYIQKVINSATWHTLSSERSRVYMSKIYPELKSKSSVIPHLGIVDYDKLPKYTKNECFTICHAGTFDGRRSPLVFFKALEIFLKNVERKKVCVQFLGNSYAGHTGFEIPQQLRDIVKLHPWADYEMTASQMAKADVLMVIEAVMEESIFLPGKFVEYVSCNRPILALTPNLSTIRDIVQQVGGGICVDANSVEETLEALIILHNSWSAGSLKRIFSPNEIQGYFDASNIINQHQHIKEMIDYNIAL